MNKLSCVLLGLFLGACSSSYDGTSVPVLQPVPNDPGRYFDQGVSAWHYVHRVEARPAIIVPQPAATPVATPDARTCPPDISREVCLDWQRNKPRRR